MNLQPTSSESSKQGLITILYQIMILEYENFMFFWRTILSFFKIAWMIGMAMAHIYVQGSGCLVGFQAVLFGQDKFSTPLTI